MRRQSEFEVTCARPPSIRGRLLASLSHSNQGENKMQLYSRVEMGSTQTDKVRGLSLIRYIFFIQYLWSSIESCCQFFFPILLATVNPRCYLSWPSGRGRDSRNSARIIEIGPSAIIVLSGYYAYDSYSLSLEHSQRPPWHNGSQSFRGKAGRLVSTGYYKLVSCDWWLIR